MKRWLLLSIVTTLTLCVQAQDKNRIPYYAEYPSSWYIQLQTGIAIPSVQDLKVSRLHWIGGGFPLYTNVGYQDNQHRLSMNLGFYGSTIQPLNGSTVRAVNYRVSSNLKYQLYQKKISKKHKVDWWTGGMIDAFYDFRNDRDLTNNQNLELFVTNLSWLNTFEKTIKVRKQEFDLSWEVAVPLLGVIGESQSFAFNVPQNSLIDGLFNYQDYDPQVFEHLRLLPLGSFFRIQSFLSASRTFEFKNRKVDVGLSYQWDFLTYGQTPNYGIFSASHQLLLTTRYYFLKARDKN